MALGIFDIFRLRAWLHKYVYQHHTVNVIEEMICDVFAEANDHLEIFCHEDGRPCRISDAVEDMTTYARLGDWILNAIESTTSAAIAPARQILQRLRCRDLYAAVYQPTSLGGPLRRIGEREVKMQILQHVDPKADLGRLAEDLLVHFVTINYGSRNADGDADNPVLHVSFFNPKLNSSQAATLCERRMPPLFMPKAFEEKLLYVYSRSDESHAELEKAYKRWRREAHAKAAVEEAQLRAAEAADAAAAALAHTPGPRGTAKGRSEGGGIGGDGESDGRGGRHGNEEGRENASGAGRNSVLTPIVTGNPASPSKAATRLARHASGGLPPKMGSPLRAATLKKREMEVAQQK